MYARADMEKRDDRPTEDHIVGLRGVSWEDYERILAVRGDHSAPRISYIDGYLEITSPSRDHEAIKSRIGAVVEAWCLDHDVEFETLGSWTLQEKPKKAGAEPDECYIFGTEAAECPHLAIEVVWTSGTIDKLEIYARLGVPEVWYWQRGRLQPYALRGGEYEAIPRSEVLPDIDLDALLDCLGEPTTSAAIRAFRKTWQGPRAR